MAYTITVTDKGINEDEVLSPNIETENDVNEGRILVIAINAFSTQVGKDNSIEQTEQGVQTLQEVVQADGDASYNVCRDLQKSLSLSASWEKKNEGSDESDDSDKEQKRPEARRAKRRVKHHSKKNSNTVRTVHQSLGPVSLSASDHQFFRMSDDIMVQLQAVRDEGQWERFEERAVTLSRQYPCYDAQIIILIERGHAACYSKHFADSKKLLKKAKHMAKDTTNASFLIGRVYYYLSAVCRRERKTGKAIDCVEIACQNLHHTDLVLDTAMLTYERASALMDFILQCVEPKSTCLDIVMSDLRRAIDQILALKEDSSQQRYLKTHRYAFMKMSMLLLDCRTATGRQRTVSEANIKEAKKYLDVIKERYWQETKRGEKIQFFLAQSDLHYRMKLYEKAEQYALEALSMAGKYGFNTEIQLVNDRLQDIRQSSALTVTRNDGSHSYKKLDECLEGNHDKNACSHGNSAIVGCSNGKNHSNTLCKFNASKIPSLIACADGHHDNTINGTRAYADGGDGNTASDVCTDSDSKREPGSSEGHVGDVSASSDSDMLSSPSYV